MEKEIWKKIEGFEGHYSISSFGRVLSHKRTTPRNVKMKDRIKSLESTLGYKKIKLFKQNRCFKFFVHRLVASAFIPNPLNKREVNHIDSNRSNNHKSNLEWVTPSENMEHFFKTGKSNILAISHLSWAKSRKPVLQKNLEGVVIRKWESISEAGRMLGTRSSDICAALKGKQKSCKGFKWEYALGYEKTKTK